MRPGAERSYLSLLSTSTRLLSTEGSERCPNETNPTNATPAQALSSAKQSKIPHLVVYALGNYPWPLSRHSLPQSILPSISQHYGLSAGHNSRRTKSPIVTQTMELDRKHQCWIGGGLVECESPRRPVKHRNGGGEAEGTNHRVILTLVMPRKSMADTQKTGPTPLTIVPTLQESS